MKQSKIKTVGLCTSLLVLMFIILTSFPAFGAKAIAPKVSALKSQKVDIVCKWDDSGLNYIDNDVGRFRPLLEEQGISQFALGDFNGQGVAGVIYVKDNQIYIRNFGDSASTLISTNAGKLITLTSGDLNGDGSDDIIGSWESGIWWRNSGNGNWKKIHDQPADLIAVGDFNGDGFGDLMGCWKNLGAWIRYGDAQDLGQWEKLSEITQETSKTLIGVSVGDLNGDGLKDIVFNFGSGVWMRDSASGKWSQLHQEPAVSIACGDVDGDGKCDLIGVWVNYPGIWALSSASGKYEKITGESPLAIAAGIINPIDLRVTEYSFKQIKGLPMMGGSLKADFINPQFSHLVKGVSIPFYFCLFEKIENPEVQDGYDYEDIANSINWGVLTIGELTPDKITFCLTRRDDNGGNLTPVNNITLMTDGPGFDLNGDGIVDIVYNSSLVSVRAAREGVRYLTFNTSEGLRRGEVKQKFLYAYAPDLDPKQNPAGGHFGFNIYGHALFRSDYLQNVTARSLNKLTTREAVTLGMQSGDYMLLVSENEKEAQYKKIETVNAENGEITFAQSINKRDEDDPEMANLDEIAVEAIGVAQWNMGDLTSYNSQIDTQMFNHLAQYTDDKNRDEYTDFQNKCNEAINTFKNLSINNIYLNLKGIVCDYKDKQNPDRIYARATLNQFMLGYGLSAKLSIGFLKLKADVTTAKIFAADIKAEASGTRLFKWNIPLPKEFTLLDKKWPLIGGGLVLEAFLNIAPGDYLYVDVKDAVSCAAGTVAYREKKVHYSAGLFYFHKSLISDKEINGSFIGSNFSSDDSQPVILGNCLYLDGEAGLRAFKIFTLSLIAEVGIKAYVELYGLNPDSYQIEGYFKGDWFYSLTARIAAKFGLFKIKKDIPIIKEVDKNLFTKHLLKIVTDRPDLIISSIDTIPAYKPAVGSQVAVYATIKNVGKVRSPDSKPLEVSLKTNANEDLGSFTVQNSSKGLAPGESYRGTSGKFWIAKAGNIKFIATADPNNKIEESEKTNNSMEATFGASSSLPDVIITDVGIESIDGTALAIGKPAHLWAKIKNIGPIATQAGIDVGIGFFINNEYYGSDFVRDTDSLPRALNAGEEYKAVCTKDWVLQSGDITLSAKADDVNRFLEEKEENNSFSKQISLLPDLQVTEIKLNPANPNAGDQVTVTATIKNFGAFATPIPNGEDKAIAAIYTVDDGTSQDAFFVKNTAGQTISLGPNESYTGTFTKKWTATKGEHKITVIGDDVNRIQESNEANNTLFIKVTPQLPDLQVTGIELNPANPSVGGQVTVKATIKNFGPGSTPIPNGEDKAVAAIYTVDGVSKDAFFVINASGQTRSLAANESYTATFNTKWTATSGTHKIGIIVDDVNRIEESKEDNNNAFVDVTPQLPDLQVTGIELSPANPNAGDEVTVKATIKNFGPGSTPIPNGEINSVAAIYTVDDGPAQDAFFVINTAGQTISLGPNESYTGTFSKKWTATKGEHKIMVIGDDVNRIVESKEDNNTFFIKVTPQLPDLQIIALQLAPASPNAGDSVTITATLKNCGPVSTPVPNGETNSVSAIYLVDGVSKEAFFYKNSAGQTIPLAAGASVSISFTTKWTATVGAHTIKVLADDVNRIEESNEGNNYLETSINVTQQFPDLQIIALQLAPASPNAGDTVTITATLKNCGPVSTPVPNGEINSVAAIYLVDGVSKDAFFLKNTAGQTIPLAAGASVSITFNTKWTATAGQHTIKIWVDDVNRIQESKEDNNTLETTINVNQQLPDLQVTALQLEPASPTAGQPVTIKATIKNCGPVSTPVPNGEINSVAAIYLVDGVSKDAFFLKNTAGQTIPLAAGASVSITFNTKWTAITGQHTIKVLADDVNRIQESDDYNNSKELVINIP
jgi:subtilase family serine protease